MALIAALYFVVRSKKKKKKNYCSLGYIVNFLYASQACTIPRHTSKCSKFQIKTKKKPVIFICGLKS